jgi:hypothetical protein
MSDHYFMSSCRKRDACHFHEPHVEKPVHLCTYWVIKSRRLRWAGHVARMGKRRGAYRALVGKPEGRRPLGRPSRRWEDNIKMDLREVEWGHRLAPSGSG